MNSVTWADDWLSLQKRVCWLCGHDYWKNYKWPGISIHHIQRRSSCYRPHQHWPENLALVCLGECHARMESMSHAEQLAIKWKHDRCGHDTIEQFLARWLLVGDHELKAPYRVTAEDILAHSC